METTFYKNNLLWHCPVDLLQNNKAQFEGNILTTQLSWSDRYLFLMPWYIIMILLLRTVNKFGARHSSQFTVSYTSTCRWKNFKKLVIDLAKIFELDYCRITQLSVQLLIDFRPSLPLILHLSRILLSRKLFFRDNSQVTVEMRLQLVRGNR